MKCLNKSSHANLIEVWFVLLSSEHYLEETRYEKPELITPGHKTR